MSDEVARGGPHHDEAARLAAVGRYDILDTPPDGALDRITAIAARILDAPIAVISIVDRDRIWFKSRHGIDVQQIDRSPGLCATAILGIDPRIVPDARHDGDAKANPLVTGEFGLRFYAGVPLRTADGHNIGTLCVIDLVPREPSADDIANLTDLASVVMEQIENRRAGRNALAQKEGLMREINHRVSNSLQLVSSMLALQGRSADSAVAAQFAQAASRVSAVAQVHRRLYQSDRVSSVDFKVYLADLVGEISRSMMAERKHSLHIDVDEADVGTDRATTLGLIVNELMTNALKHAYGRNDTAPVAVAFVCRARDCELSVSDRGVGLPDGFDPARQNGLGMKLVRSLVAQIGGSLHHGPGEDGRGARFSVKFRLD